MQVLNAIVDAAIRYSSMIGLIIDVLGTLYMAYDLF